MAVQELRSLPTRPVGRRNALPSVICSGLLWVFGIAELLQPQRTYAGESLRLVARVNGRDVDQFKIEDGKILIAADGAPAQPLAGRVEWRLEGELWRNAHLFHFAPHCTITRTPVHARDRGDHPQPVATVAVESSEDAGGWRASVLRGGIVVTAWLVDGSIARLAATPVLESKGVVGGMSGVAEFSLSEGQERGAPALLLLTPRGFLAPRPLFRIGAANDALAAMYLRSSSDFAAAAERVQTIDAGTDDGVTLLHLAAGGGFQNALTTLLRRGAKGQASTPALESPMECAIRTNRMHGVATLLGAEAPAAANPAQAAEWLNAAMRLQQIEIGGYILETSGLAKSGPRA